MRWAGAVLGCGLVLAACKSPVDDKFDEPGDGGRVPPGRNPIDEPPQAAAQIAVAPASGSSCSAAHGVLLIPNDQTVSQNITCELIDPSCKPGATVVVDGENDATVDCSVTQVDSNYAVLATVTQKGNAISLNGMISANGGTVTMTHRAAATQINLRGECEVSIVQNHGLVAPGKLWATFSCSSLTDPNSAAAMSCSAQGSVIFEKCEK